MTEVATNETLVYLANLVKSSLEETKSFWGSLESGSKLLPLVDITSTSQIVDIVLHTETTLS
jgi:E3 ubiquitin-protein ligase HUWE1